MDKVKVVILLMCFLVSNTVGGQKIFQSKEINIRNDKLYDLFHFEQGRNIIYRDRGNEQMVEVFNSDLEFERTVTIDLHPRRHSIDGVYKFDDKIHFYYTYREDSKAFLAVRSLGIDDLVLDTARVIMEGDEFFLKGSLKTTISNDGSKVLFFEKNLKGVNIIVVDNSIATVIYKNIFKSEIVEILSEFESIDVSNNGDVFMVFERNNYKYKKDEHSLFIVRSAGRDFILNEYLLNGIIHSGFETVYDEINNKLVLAGLYSKKNEDDLIGYFIIDTQLASETGQIVFKEFDSSIFKDLYGRKSKRDNTLQDFYIEKIIPRYDGGMIMVFEMSREFVRRSAYGMMSRFDGDNMVRGFVDYYNEDIIVASTKPSGEEDWIKVFYKKQFSQDDGGTFSSFFSFTTPSRIHMIYNDEIKKNSTVSEYVISPSGKFERNTVLNTEYKDLQLRLRDALQISTYEFLVPSETNYKLSLVKVKL